jgi:heterodisulfide reductase subunit C
MISQIIFILALIASIYFFTQNLIRIRKNIGLGRPINLEGDSISRWKTMARVALGQSKLVSRPLAGFMHVLIYLGFILINIEVLEIVLDGILGTHRVFSRLGGFYNFLIGFFEILAVGVLLACFVFLIRRHIGRLKRFTGIEMKKWPREDADIILFTEILLMSAFLIMNGSDLKLQTMHFGHYLSAGSFPVSSLLLPILPGKPENLEFLERSCWWFHILGILVFLNYLPFSKHFHILIAFPNTYFSNLKPKGQFLNMAQVTNEVKSMLDPSFIAQDPGNTAQKFGAKDIGDLSWKNLMDAYSCTECGRCTSECPANITGKLLSPRKIMMDTRDRMVELGKYKEIHGAESTDQKTLLHDYILPEELWACTTCNACTQACPVNIDPLNIIIQLRQYLVMEDSNAPASLNGMFNNIENNGAPWPFSPSDRLNWAQS